MDLVVRELAEGDLDAVVRLSLRAWEPVHASIRQALGPDLSDALTPDWRVSQERDVVEVCSSPENRVWVGVLRGAVVAFVAVHIHEDRTIGEIAMLAVDPDAQHEGVGTTLTGFAVHWIRDAGVPVAMVETGSDPGHALARRTYEKAGFTLVPVARYFLKL